MFTLCCKITVGKSSFSRVNEVLIKRSICDLMDSATIKLPATATLCRSGEPPVKIEIAQIVKIGDKVTIELGYNNAYNIEFCGYLKSIDLKIPIELHCENEFYTCRTRYITHSGTISLSALLNKCGVGIAIAESLTIKGLIIKDKSVAYVLGKLQTDYGLSVFFDLDGKLYACRRYSVVGKEVKYTLRKNVINDDSLQYSKKDDAKVSVSAISFKRDGTKVEAKKGADGGEKKTIYFYDVDSVEELTALAQREIDRYTVDGYSGKIETFLLPIAAPGMVANITDEIYSDRSGKYYIEQVEIKYGLSGARRIIEIGEMQ